MSLIICLVNMDFCNKKLNHKIDKISTQCKVEWVVLAHVLLLVDFLIIF